MKATAILLLLACLALPGRSAEIIQADICVYGGTAAGVAAAVEAARMGQSTVLLEPGDHLGGMTSGGLGATDIGNKAAIGGIAREFYHRIALHYARNDAWWIETRDSYFKHHATRNAPGDLNAPDATMWTFEPHVAESVLFDMVNEAKVSVYLRQPLATVKTEKRWIREIATESGRIYRAKMFIDATYEGDLMAKAGVSYTVGREGNSQYNETLDGVRAQTPKHQFTVSVDPFLTPGDPRSGLLPFIQPVPFGEPGSKDASVQAYNFRLCYTRDPANRLPNKPPPGYKASDYELLARYIEALAASGKKPALSQFWNPLWMPNDKTDINNNGAFSTDFIGRNYDYPDASYSQRAQIWEAHKNYTLGFVYFLATGPRVPENMRKEMQSWGPARDEFYDTGGWPNQLYIREARRMLSDYVMTEHNCRGEVRAQDGIGLAAYGMDSHNCRRLVRDGHVENEGDTQVGGFSPYPISYRSIVPKASECENLLVPVCLSATHISYGSIRMEPVFMILGQSAATAAALAIQEHHPAQKVSYPKLRARLLQDKQVLEWTGHKPPHRR
ncbi:MAG TPA: FAD-dependent oxidoreductase [Verrucomicrobiae bacterium]|nr:FAD-dependent oxidoreductase [Verrucomicrobiae bacterium]